jgi:hypothetical protein
MFSFDIYHFKVSEHHSLNLIEIAPSTKTKHDTKREII